MAKLEAEAEAAKAANKADDHTGHAVRRKGKGKPATSAAPKKGDKRSANSNMTSLVAIFAVVAALVVLLYWLMRDPAPRAPVVAPAAGTGTAGEGSISEV